MRKSTVKPAQSPSGISSFFTLMKFGADTAGSFVQTLDQCKNLTSYGSISASQSQSYQGIDAQITIEQSAGRSTLTISLEEPLTSAPPASIPDGK